MPVLIWKNQVYMSSYFCIQDEEDDVHDLFQTAVLIHEILLRSHRTLGFSSDGLLLPTCDFDSAKKVPVMFVSHKNKLDPHAEDRRWQSNIKGLYLKQVKGSHTN